MIAQEKHIKYDILLTLFFSEKRIDFLKKNKTFSTSQIKISGTGKICSLPGVCGLLSDLV